jgi:hypothetical protein
MFYSRFLLTTQMTLQHNHEVGCPLPKVFFVHGDWEMDKHFIQVWSLMEFLWTHIASRAGENFLLFYTWNIMISFPSQLYLRFPALVISIPSCNAHYLMQIPLVILCFGYLKHDKSKFLTDPYCLVNWSLIAIWDLMGRWVGYKCSDLYFHLIPSDLLNLSFYIRRKHSTLLLINFHWAPMCHIVPEHYDILQEFCKCQKVPPVQQYDNLKKTTKRNQKNVQKKSG